MQAISTVVVKDIDTKQQLLMLPMTFVRRHDSGSLVEFTELDVNTLALALVDPRTPLTAKRYKLVVHNGGAQVSVPRSWLRNLSVKDGDSIELCESPDSPNRLFVRYVREGK